MQNNSKVAVVTGGGSGLGLAAAIDLAKKGVRIAVIDINETNAKKAVDEISKYNDAKMWICDISKAPTIKPMVDEIAEYFGRIDILLNCAAITDRTRSKDLTEEKWDRFMDLDLKSPFFMIQACAPYMKKAGGGRVINFSSMRSTIADGKHVLYSVAKAAMNALAREWSTDLCHDNIQVNSILPSYIITPINEMLLDDPGWKEHQMTLTLNKRLMYPKDVIGTISFLALCKTKQVVGTNIYTDGGYLNFKYKAL